MEGQNSMFKNRLGFRSIVALLSLAPLPLACSSSGDSGSFDEGVESVETPAFADTRALRGPAFGSHFTVFTMCWDASANPTGALKALYDAGRAAVQQEITATWDGNSWVNFVWRANCSS